MHTRTALLPQAPPAPGPPTPPPTLHTPAHPLRSSSALRPHKHSPPLPAPCAARISCDTATSSLLCASASQSGLHHLTALVSTAPLAPSPSSKIRARHATNRSAASLCVCASASRDEARPSSSSSSSRSSSPVPPSEKVSSSPFSTPPGPAQPQQQQLRTRSGSTGQLRTGQQRGPTSGFASSGSYDDDLQLSPPYPASPHPSFASMDGPSSDELLRPSPSGRGGSGGSAASSTTTGEDSLSSYLAATFSRTPRSSPSGRSNNRRSRLSMPQSYDTPGSGGLGPGSAASRDPFASFRAYQQAAPLQQGATLGLDGGERLQAFRRAVMPKLRSGWYASPGHTAESLSQEILTRCERKPIGLQPLFLLVRLCESQEDARTALATISAVRAAAARLQGNLVPFMSHAGHKLARAFTSMCCRCDASDVMASALIHASEVGLPITYKCVHLAMTHWAQLQELPKMEQVLDAMPQGGLPFIPKTAYIIIRGAVNAGRQELAEMYAARMMAAGVRLHPSVNMLLEIGRERARQRAQALQGSEEEW